MQPYKKRMERKQRGISFASGGSTIQSMGINISEAGQNSRDGTLAWKGLWKGPLTFQDLEGGYLYPSKALTF